MSTIHWTALASFNFTHSASWSGGVIPGAADDAVLDAAGTTLYTVTASTAQTVNSIQTAANATLAVSNTVFHATNGTGVGMNKGAIRLTNATLYVGGALANAGAIRLGTTTQAGDLIIQGAVALTGGGTVTLSPITGGVQDALLGSPGAVLTNVDNTITGGGIVGGDGLSTDWQLTIVNQAHGVIAASGATQMLLETQGHVLANQGLIKAIGAGGLAIANTTVDDSGGGAIVGQGAKVDLQNVRVIGGSMSTTGAGVIHSDTGTTNVLDGTGAGGLANSGQVVVDDGSTLTLVGAISNPGTLRVGGATQTTQLMIGAGGAALDGALSGQLVLTSAAYSLITGATAASTLTISDFQFITGQGQVGGGQMTLVLKPQSFINANAAGAMVLSMGAGSIANAGIIRSSGAGGMTVVDTLVNNALGGFNAVNSSITLRNARIIGGSLEADGSGVIVSDGSLFDGRTSAIAILGKLQVAASSTATLEGAFNNMGTLAVGATGVGGATFGTVLVAGSASLTGGGKVILSDTGDNTITGVTAGTTLTNVNNTISGSGLIGGTRIALVNQASGVIWANGSNALTIDTAGLTMINGGLMEATGAGGLGLENVRVNGASGGNIYAISSVVTLRGATIAGGTLVSSGSGVFQTLDAFSVLDGRASVVTSDAEIDVGGATKLTLEGAIANASLIALDGVGGYSSLVVAAAGATLSGHGQVTLSDMPTNIIAGATKTATLTNVDNTISGSGQIGQGRMTLVNQAGGVINGNGVDNSDSAIGLVINTGTTTIANAGLIESTGTGRGVTVLSPLANSGALKVGEDAGMRLTQNVVNTGQIMLAGTVSGAYLNLSDGKTLSGAGTVTLSDSANNVLTFGNGAVNLDNAISGAGYVGGVFVNRSGAIINATGAVNALNLNGSVTNTGLIEATGAAGLVITAAVDDTGGGAIKAMAGSKVTLGGVVSGGTVAGVGGGVLFGGGGELDGSASAVTLAGPLRIEDGGAMAAIGTINNTGSISLNASSSGVILIMSEGTGASTLLQGGGTIALGDNALNSLYIPIYGTLTNVNNLITGSGDIQRGILINQAAGVINASGAVNGLNLDLQSISNAGLIESTGAGGGVITATGAITNTGTLQASGGVLDVKSAVTGAGVGMVAAGTLAFEDSFTENVSFTGVTGTLTLFKSQGYTGTISGFSHAGGTLLDLRDIGFVSAGEATFVGNTSGGVLTVTDGVHTASIALVGDYTASTFVAAADGHGGVVIHDPKAHAAPLPPFVQAVAGLGSPAHMVAGPATFAPHAGVALAVGRGFAA